MSTQYDPELDDILQDTELMHVADLLRAGRMTDPPLDDAFRSALRRQLMNRAWGMDDGGGVHWWQKIFGPVGLAWAGAAVGVILIGAVVVLSALNSAPGGLTREVLVTSPMSDGTAVRLQQPILVNFNQAMDHPSTEAAVQITPATTVAFSWNANTLAVLPSSGNLAPNTQYQVTIGPTAKTAAGQVLTAPKTITFVTQPPPPPAPSPSPVASPSPKGNITSPRQLAAGPGITNVTWSPDSSTVFFIGGKGELESATAAAGNPTVLVADGVTTAALSPAGDHIAYIRNGKVEVLALTSPATVEIVPTPAPVIAGWTKDGVEWAAADGVYRQGADGPSKIAALPATGAVKPISFSPDGAHLAFTQDQSLQVLDVATGKSSTLGIAGAQFLGWSPDGTGVMYSGAQAVVLADIAGKTLANLPAGEPSWSSQDEVLLGSDTDLFQIRPDGSGLTKLAEGTFHLPVWAPNGTSFTYFRGSPLFSATAPSAPPKPPALDAAAAVVKNFMEARKAGQSDKALAILDDNGKRAYSSSSGGLSLTVTGDPSFSRSYVLTQEITGTQPDTARFVVRIVLAHEKLDVSTYEETLTLIRTQGSGQFLVDQAVAGPQLALGKSASVVSVDVSSSAVRITFDSDLQPGTVREGVILLDGKGKQVGEAPQYASKTVTFGGLELKPGATYKLVVLPTVKDVSGNNIAAEYDLMFVGPGDSHGDKQNGQGSNPSPQAKPSSTP
jgi:Tol biopolymer transport system component